MVFLKKSIADENLDLKYNYLDTLLTCINLHTNLIIGLKNIWKSGKKVKLLKIRNGRKTLLP